MRCPDWTTLVARRDGDPHAGEEAWARALAHLDDCPHCRDAAVAAEPTVIFRHLPAPEVGADDVAAMQQAVAAMRRPATVGRHRPIPRRHRVRGWQKVAAVAAVLVAAVLLRGTGPEETDPIAPAASPVAAVALPAPVPTPDAALAAYDPAAIPLVEDVDPSYGALIQLVDDDFAIVMVMAEERDNYDV